MELFTKLIHSRTTNVLLGIFLSLIWGIFAWTHIRAFEDSGKIAFIVFAFSETLQAIFFMIRKTPKTISADPFSWLVAGGGTFVPLFLRPGGIVLWAYGDMFVFIGVILQILGLMSLNRSFAIVAANRQIKTSGMYKFIRHPMYASYLFLFFGYFLFNATPTNALLVIFAYIFMFLRITEEEKLLSKDTAYQTYKQSVQWRLIPFVY